MRVSPSTVVLAAGESKTITAEISLTNTAVPAPLEGSLSFGGAIHWRGGAHPIHLAWGCVKAAFLTVQLEGAETQVALARVIRRGSTHGFLLPGGYGRLFLPLGEIDLVTQVDSRQGPLVITTEQVTIEGEPRLDLARSAAELTILAETTDESGGPLTRPGRDCWQMILLSFPGGKVMVEQQRRYPWSAHPLTRFSPFSERVKVYVLDRCGDAENSSVYAALHEPFRGLARNVTTTSRPEWLRQDLRFVPESSDARWATDALPVMWFPGSGRDMYVGGGWFHLMRGTGPVLEHYFTRSPEPGLRLLSYLERSGRCSDAHGDGRDCSVVDEVRLQLSEETVSVDWIDDRFGSPMSHQMPLGSAIALGVTPTLWPEGHFVAVPGAWQTLVRWRGRFGEVLGSDGDVTVTDVAGRVVGEGLAGILKFETLPPGRYRIEATDTPRNGRRALPARYVATADTSRADPLLPRFTGFRVLDARGNVATAVDRDSNASLVFSAIDDTPGPDKVLRTAPKEELIRVQYRRHETEEWRALVPIAIARDYDTPGFGHVMGTVFRVDLGTLTRDITGPVDIRIHIEDAAGNTAELQLERALTVASVGRRRSVGR